MPSTILAQILHNVGKGAIIPIAGGEPEWEEDVDRAAGLILQQLEQSLDTFVAQVTSRPVLQSLYRAIMATLPPPLSAQL